MKVTFAHGLWSSTESSKAAWMRAQGWEVEILDMRKHGWDQASQTQVVLEAIDRMGPVDVLIGSSHPTAILHGNQDDVVPLANSERAKADSAHVSLHVVADGHRLHESLNELLSLTRLVMEA